MTTGKRAPDQTPTSPVTAADWDQARAARGRPLTEAQIKALSVYRDRKGENPFTK